MPVLPAAAFAGTFVAGCKALPLTTNAVATANNGNVWIRGYPQHGAVCNYNHYGPPNAMSCAAADETNETYGGYAGSIPPTSNHPGGVNVCFADGSVKFIKDTIALSTWWGLGTRNGREVIDSSSY